MRLLLLKDVPKLGHVGDVIEANPGYARNYLLPQRVAAEPTEENLKAIEEEKKRAAAQRARRLTAFQQLAERVRDASVTLEAAANEEGTLYGSVGAREIAEALQAQGFEVPAENVVLDSPIRTLDNRIVSLRFTDEITAEVKVWVVRAGAGDDAEESSGLAGSEESKFESDPE